MVRDLGKLGFFSHQGSIKTLSMPAFSSLGSLDHGGGGLERKPQNEMLTPLELCQPPAARGPRPGGRTQHGELKKVCKVPRWE